MKAKFNLRMYCLLLAAGLAFTACAAQSAGGVTLTQTEETKVAVGMSANEVQQNLGPPGYVRKYYTAHGPTWVYYVAGAPFGKTNFDVEFGSDGKVVSVGERVVGGY